MVLDFFPRLRAFAWGKSFGSGKVAKSTRLRPLPDFEDRTPAHVRKLPSLSLDGFAAKRGEKREPKCALKRSRTASTLSRHFST